MSMSGEQFVILLVGLAMLYFGMKKGKAAVAVIGGAVALIILVTTIEGLGTKLSTFLSGLIDLIKGLF